MLRNLVLILSVAGCAAHFRSVERMVRTDAVEIDADWVSDGEFSVKVTNRLDKPMTVNRDALALRTPKGLRKRMPAHAIELTSMYLVPPGGTQEVHAAFATADLDEGSAVALVFDGALAVEGKGITVAPLPYLVDDGR